MEFEFDKEIDAILRKARRSGEIAASFDSHPDADELSAFAENALSEAANQRYTAHLADCTRCRKILSNIILFNAEAETETASSDVAVEIAEVKTPWYRKFFTFPQSAYTMGAFVLLFSGLFGYLVLKNLSSGNSDVSYSVDKSEQMEKNASQSAPISPSAANKPAANAPAPMNAPANVSGVTNSAPVSQSNTDVSSVPSERKSAESEPMPEGLSKPTVAPQPTAPVSVSEDADKNLAKTSPQNEVKQPATDAVAGATREENKPRDKKEAYSTKDDSRTDDEVSDKRLKTTRSAPETPKKQKSEAGEARNVGGKTFNNVGGIWFDSAYTNQKRKTVVRGTSDYQKLDSGLRSIAEQFSGTVVIVWKSKAYQIQ